MAARCYAASRPSCKTAPTREGAAQQDLNSGSTIGRWAMSAAAMREAALGSAWKAAARAIATANARRISGFKSNNRSIAHGRPTDRARPKSKRKACGHGLSMEEFGRR